MIQRLAVLTLALLLTGAKHAPSSSWTLRYSSGVALTSPLGFEFPRAPGSVNYLTEDYTSAITAGQSLTMTLRIVGAPVFNYMTEPWNNCISPATARPYIEAQVPKKCPDATYTCAPPSARQWSNPAAIELQEGTFSLTVPFNPAMWSDAEGVYGQNDLNGFYATLNHPRYAGMTFGGGCFFGHGVNVNGPAHIYIDRFSIN